MTPAAKRRYLSQVLQHNAEHTRLTLDGHGEVLSDTQAEDANRAWRTLRRIAGELAEQEGQG
jgi:RNA:NAD 2'-phosphotransferase (TPT1/KptA family)